MLLCRIYALPQHLESKVNQTMRNIDTAPTLTHATAINPRTKDYFLHSYEELDIEASLQAYMNNGLEEQDLGETLSRFSSRLAGLATREGYLDTDVVRFGVEHLTDSMNDVCRQAFEPPAKTGILSLLAKAGIGSQPPGKTYIKKLDERYWSKQFLEQHKDGSLTQRRRGEGELEYLERYIDAVVHGFIFAPFTFVRP